MRNTFFIVLFFCAQFAFSINVDSLFQTIKNYADTQQVSLLLNYAEKVKKKNFSDAKELSIKALEVAEKTKLTEYINKSYLSVAQSYLELSDNDSADFYINKIENQERNNLTANILQLKGRLLYTSANYSDALKLFLEAQVIYDSLKNEFWSTKINVDIGNVYAHQGQYSKARSYYQRALDLAIVREETKIQASALNNIAIMYKAENKFDDALIYLNKSLTLYNKEGQLRGIGLTLSNMGDLYAKKNDFDKAIDYHLQALEIKKKLNDNAGVSHSYNRIGKIYYETGKYYHAINVLIEAQSLFEKFKYRKGLQENYETLALVYKELRMYKTAFEYQKKYSEITAELFNEFTTSQISEMQAKYEDEKKSKEIALLQKEKELNQSKAKRQRILRLSLILLLIFSFTILFLVYNRFRIKQRTIKMLAKQNKEIIQKNEEIESQSEYLSNLNKELEKLSIVASKTDNAVLILDSKTNVQWVNDGFTRMYGYTLEEIADNKTRNLIGSLSSLHIKDIVNIWYGDKKSMSIETINTTKSGDKVWSQSTITPIKDKSKNVQFLIVIESDITALKKAGEEITRKSTELLSSIEYAKKIQKSIMPHANSLKDYFKDHFIFLRPKDVVSGDFYWFVEVDDSFILVCADCTGHGVPGAFMSLIGIDYLNQIIVNDKVLQPDLILDKLKKNIFSSLNKYESDSVNRDGIDLSILKFDKTKRNVQFSGAMSTIYICRNKEIIEIQGDKYPIGYTEFLDKPYNLSTLSLQENDTLYLFTDGFPDQFGGKKNKKFKYRNFKELFKQISHHPLEYQKELISNTYVEWKGINEQVDDILIIGIKI